mmetsp:Transcript_30237/g.63171  ORF Transcript_30237/g.63171 Transcript_30237/m.63171 type:complete len:80 (+) Transcript_30237:329-568(+)
METETKAARILLRYDTAPVTPNPEFTAVAGGRPFAVGEVPMEEEEAVGATMIMAVEEEMERAVGAEVEDTLRVEVDSAC